MNNLLKALLYGSIFGAVFGIIQFIVFATGGILGFVGILTGPLSLIAYVTLLILLIRWSAKDKLNDTKYSSEYRTIQ
jgi:predicted PurR-regulated permease PerM